MKLYKSSILAFAALALGACNDINDIEQFGGAPTADQVQNTVSLIPSRANADFVGMFTMMGDPGYTFGDRADDFGFIMSAISSDAEGPDLQFPNSGYNWFSTCGELTSRTPTYANPFIRYSTPYAQIKIVNDLLRNYVTSEEDMDNEDVMKELSEEAVNRIAQARALRAFDYEMLAPFFQFSYAAGAQDKPCVPIVTLATEDAANNPRATVAEVYAQIMKDLDWAIAHLDAQRDGKQYVNIDVAYGLRARANLAMENWAAAAADAEMAMKGGYQPASIAAVSTPSFYDINDANWIWGYDMTDAVASHYSYATWPSWLGVFSEDAYACGVGVYACINNLLYDKISDTDVRKGWWIDENLESPLLETVSWGGVSGKALAELKISDVKEPYIPYTNVKFGAAKIPTATNEEDFPFMRVEEMILIQAEGLLKSGKDGDARKVLTDFVKNYRDPQYSIPSDRTLADEIWFQRRVELWGEGFGWTDMMRLNKPLVRIHDDKPSNYADAFQFNLPAGDGWMLMRFPQQETNYNFGVVNNTDGQKPTSGLNGKLRDGVTD